MVNIGSQEEKETKRLHTPSARISHQQSNKAVAFAFPSPSPPGPVSVLLPFFHSFWPSLCHSLAVLLASSSKPNMASRPCRLVRHISPGQTLVRNVDEEKPALAKEEGGGEKGISGSFFSLGWRCCWVGGASAWLLVC